jgi:hypothetical protein
MAWASVGIAEAHGALKNHAEHRSASGVLLYFAAVLRTPDYKGSPVKQSREVMAPAVDSQTRKEATPGGTEHPPHKRRLMKFVKVHGRTSYHRGFLRAGGQRPVGGRPDLRVHGMGGPSRGRFGHAGDCQLEHPSTHRDDRRKAGGLITGRERYSSTQNGAPYERIGPAASHICNGRTSHQRHESQRNPGNTMNRED